MRHLCRRHALIELAGWLLAMQCQIVSAIAAITAKKLPGEVGALQLMRFVGGFF
jgi:hypothetical protein